MLNISDMPSSVARSLRRWTRWFVWPIVSRLLPRLSIGDPYATMAMPIPRERFGSPYTGAFVDYLAGPSTVAVHSLDDIEAFLRGCVYEFDPTRAEDWTTLAATFERNRSGNCLDHALWAWRKLQELGHAPELVVGVANPNQTPFMRHAWVVIARNERRVVLETITKDPERSMLQGIRPNVEYYWPEVGVDHAGRPFGYNGMIRFFKVQAGLPWQDPVMARGTV